MYKRQVQSIVHFRSASFRVFSHTTVLRFSRSPSLPPFVGVHWNTRFGHCSPAFSSYGQTNSALFLLSHAVFFWLKALCNLYIAELRLKVIHPDSIYSSCSCSARPYFFLNIPYKIFTFNDGIVDVPFEISLYQHIPLNPLIAFRSRQILCLITSFYFPFLLN